LILDPVLNEAEAPKLYRLGTTSSITAVIQAVVST